MDRVWVYAVLIVVVIGGAIPYAMLNAETKVEKTYYQVYQATFPFGTITSKGDLHGGGGLFTWHLTGEIYPVEVYSVKYLDNNQLWTVLIDAEHNPVVIDGTLRLEKVVSTNYEPAFYFWKQLVSKNVGYVLHIPSLPETNQTMIDVVG